MTKAEKSLHNVEFKKEKFGIDASTEYKPPDIQADNTRIRDIRISQILAVRNSSRQFAAVFIRNRMSMYITVKSITSVLLSIFPVRV